MKYTEYVKTVKDINAPETLEFRLYPILLMNRDNIPRGLASIGSTGMKVIKVPQYVEIPPAPNAYMGTGWAVPVISVSSTAFAGNENITDIILPPGIRTIPGGAFAGCRNLRNITIPRNVKKIRKGTFAGCASLENIYYEGTMEDWEKVEVVHNRHEIEFGDLIPGTPVSSIVSEILVNIPGNEAVFSANVHFRCNTGDIVPEKYPGTRVRDMPDPKYIN